MPYHVADEVGEEVREDPEALVEGRPARGRVRAAAHLGRKAEGRGPEARQGEAGGCKTSHATGLRWIPCAGPGHSSRAAYFECSACDYSHPNLVRFIQHLVLLHNPDYDSILLADFQYNFDLNIMFYVPG